MRSSHAMPRNKISFSKRSKSPKPAPPLCGVSNCHHKCWMGSLRGEMVESEYCEKRESSLPLLRVRFLLLIRCRYVRGEACMRGEKEVQGFILP